MLDENKIKQIAQDVFDSNSTQNQFAVSSVGFHTHNGQDSQNVAFTNLADVPLSYYGNAGKFLRVNSTENLLEFASASASASASANARSYGSGVTSVPDITDTKITLSTNSFANGVTWDATNSRFVIVTAGQYQINAQVTYTGGTTTLSVYRAVVVLNTSTEILKSCSQSSGASALTTSVSDIYSLSVGDTLELHAFQSSGLTATIATTSIATFLSIAKV